MRIHDASGRADHTDILVAPDGNEWIIALNAVTDAKLRDSAALSVIGRESNTVGDPADIIAAGDKSVLHQDGAALVFSLIDNTYVSDFVEAAQDAIGGILADTATIDLTYDDATPAISADLSAATLAFLAAIEGATFLTESDETATFANSRRLVPGTNITFDTTTPGQFVINSSGSGSVASVQPGFGILVDNTDPANPIVSVDEAMAPTWTALHTFSSGALGANFTSTTQISERIRLSGQEYTAPATTSTDGVAMVLGVNRANNRQLWILDSAKLAANSTNPVCRIGVLAGQAFFDCVSTDNTVSFPVRMNDSTLLIARPASANAAFRLQVGAGTADTRAVFNPSTAFAVGMSQGAANGFFYIGASAAANADCLFSNNAGTEIMAVQGDGRVYGRFLHNHPGSMSGTVNQYIASGTYTPTLTAIANISALTATVGQWLRIGNVVTVSGFFTGTSGAAGGVQVGITLPIASALTAIGQLSGSGCADIGAAKFACPIFADAANDRAELRWTATGANSSSVNFHFTYVIL